MVAESMIHVYNALDDVCLPALSPSGNQESGFKGKVTKQTLMELALSKELKERQEMEKKLHKQAKTMDYMEEAPLIEAAYQRRLVEEMKLHDSEQLQENELSRQHHAGDLQEKNRLARMLESKAAFQDRIINRRETECKRLKREMDDRISQLRAERRQEREIKRKLLFYLKTEEERMNRLREEEETWKREEFERWKKEEAEQKAKLDEMAERQRRREKELEEKERLSRESLLGRASELLPRSMNTASGACRPEAVAAASAAAAPAPRKYVPRLCRERLSRESLLGRASELLPRSMNTASGACCPEAVAAASAAAAPAPRKYVPRLRRESQEGQSAVPPLEHHRWGRHDDHQLQGSDRWRSDYRRLPSSSSWSSSRGRS